MSRKRRKSWARVVLKIGLVLLALDAVGYVVVERSLAALVTEKYGQFNSARAGWLQERMRVASLEKENAALPGELSQLKSFLAQHLPARRQGFSSAALLLQRLTQQSNVQLSGISYNLSASKGEPLDHMSLGVYVQGSFANLLAFAHTLETAQDLVVVRSFKFNPGDGGALGLRMTADLYLMP